MDFDTGSNADLCYSITTSNAHGYFGIREDTGEIVVNKSLDLEGPTPPVLHYILGKVAYFNCTDLHPCWNQRNILYKDMHAAPVYLYCKKTISN